MKTYTDEQIAEVVKALTNAVNYAVPVFFSKKGPDLDLSLIKEALAILAAPQEMELDANLRKRDDFIVRKGLWSEFVYFLTTSPAQENEK